jgi:hypothetical protein
MADGGRGRTKLGGIESASLQLSIPMAVTRYQSRGRRNWPGTLEPLCVVGLGDDAWDGGVKVVVWRDRRNLV